MIDRVAHEVEQRIFQGVEHRTVDPLVFALDDELEFFPQVLGELTHHARVRLEEHRERDHAQRGDLFGEHREIFELFGGQHRRAPVHLRREFLRAAQARGEIGGGGAEIFRQGDQCRRPVADYRFPRSHGAQRIHSPS